MAMTVGDITMNADALDRRYEVYVELFQITMWRDGCVYATESRGCGWYPKTLTDANRPAATWLMYVAASDEYAQTHSTIRLARTTPA
jgi:hypothetical protein